MSGVTDTRPAPSPSYLCAHGDCCLLLRINHERFVCAALPMDTAVRAARELVTSALRAWAWGSNLRGDVVLVVSELVTNAVLHGNVAEHITVRCYVIGSWLRFEVDDHTERTPTSRPLDDAPESGRGLHLVDALSTAWGWQEATDGKTVWAEWLLPDEEQP